MIRGTQVANCLHQHQLFGCACVGSKHEQHFSFHHVFKLATGKKIFAGEQGSRLKREKSILYAVYYDTILSTPVLTLFLTRKPDSNPIKCIQKLAHVCLMTWLESPDLLLCKQSQLLAILQLFVKKG